MHNINRIQPLLRHGPIWQRDQRRQQLWLKAMDAIILKEPACFGSSSWRSPWDILL